VKQKINPRSETLSGRSLSSEPQRRYGVALFPS